jgi:hypothetical protein
LRTVVRALAAGGGARCRKRGSIVRQTRWSCVLGMERSVTYGSRRSNDNWP